MENLTRITVPAGPQTDPEPLSSPHFDDETTLLSARPVVPIGRRLNLQRVRNPLLTIAILLIAAMVGAIAALSIDRFQSARRSDANAGNQVSAPVTEPAGNTSGTLETSEGDALPAGAPETSATISPRREARVRPPVQAAAAPRTAVKISTDDGSVRERVVSKLPRAAATGRENAPRQTGADSVRARHQRHAGRISEIFEGPSPF